jgi:enoyl-[acyl-carrier protein] reductase III
MSALFSLQGKTALITGGTRGVGRALSLAFARAGALVTANYVRNQASADSLVQAAADEGLAIQLFRADISGEAGVKQVLERLDASGQKLDLFVHCAATGVHRPAEQLTLRHFDWTFALNVRAFFHLTTQLIPRMSQGSSILAISSEGAQRAIEQYTLVGSSKGALEAMVRHFAAELAPKGIRVNAISPGTLLTDAWESLPNAAARLEKSIQRTPLNRLVTLEEVAAVAQFLCSPAASGIVGQTVVVDGGARISAH